jgi:hypothetical protein
MSDDATRGERNNNPGNLNYIEVGGWQGQLGLEEVPEGRSFTPRFGRYDSSSSGIRAIAKQLLAYQEKHGCRTPRDFVERWAPPSENSTDAYAKDVAAVLGVSPETPIDLTDPATLQVMTRAIIRHENGRCLYAAATIASACQLALA